MNTLVITASLLHLTGTVLVFFMLMSAVFGKKFYRAVVSTISGLRYEKSYRFSLTLLAVGISINFFLVIMQNHDLLQPAVDLTGNFLQIEKSVAEFFQLCNCTAVNYVAAFAYFLLFPALLLAVMPILDYTGHEKAMRQYLNAIAFALLITVPVFAAVEVREVWLCFKPGAYFASTEMCQRFFNLRSFNFTGNCLPSIHTALTVIAMRAVRWTQCRYYTAVIDIIGGMIILSILILGIHWLADIFAGCALAWISLKLSAIRESKHNQIMEAVS